MANVQLLVAFERTFVIGISLFVFFGFWPMEARQQLVRKVDASSVDGLAFLVSVVIPAASSSP